MTSNLTEATREELIRLNTSLDAAIRREQRTAQERDNVAADLAQVRLYIEDALLVGEDDIGIVRDILHGALDVGQ